MLNHSEDRLVEQTAIGLLQSLCGRENFINAYAEEEETKLRWRQRRSSWGRSC
jgi:hypothetical protein